MGTRDCQESGTGRPLPLGGDTKSKEEDAFVYHRARSGDTLDSLARKYGVSVQAIRAANGLKGNALKQKQTYRIPKAEKTASAKPEKAHGAKPEKTASTSAPGGQSKSGRPRK